MNLPIAGSEVEWNSHHPQISRLNHGYTSQFAVIVSSGMFSHRILGRFPPFRNALDPPHSLGPTPSFH